MYEWANEMNCAVNCMRHKGNHPIYERESTAVTLPNTVTLIWQEISLIATNPHSQAQETRTTGDGGVNAYTLRRIGCQENDYLRHGSMTEWSVAWWRFRWKYPE